MVRPSPMSGRLDRLVRLATPGRLAFVGLLVAAALPLALVQSGPVLSPFRLSTGLPDPGCGLTRSVVALMHGDLAASLFFHPLGPVVVAALVLLAVVDLNPWRAMLSEAGPRAARLSSGTALLRWLASGPLIWVGVATFLLIWLIRLPLFLAGIWIY